MLSLRPSGCDACSSSLFILIDDCLFIPLLTDIQVPAAVRCRNHAAVGTIRGYWQQVGSVVAGSWAVSGAAGSGAAVTGVRAVF